MIPINRENVRDVLIAVLCIAAACWLFYLAGCGKPAAAGNIPSIFDPLSPAFQGPLDNATSVPENCFAKTLVNGVYTWEKSPKGAFLPTPPYTLAVSCNASRSPLITENLPTPAEIPLPVKGGGVVPPEDSGNAHYPLPANPPLAKCLTYDGTKWVDCPDDPKMPVLSPPKCPNKLPALAVMIADPSFPDVWRGAYLCNAREIVPRKLGGRWHYVDQKRYGYREWRQK